MSNSDHNKLGAGVSRPISTLGDLRDFIATCHSFRATSRSRRRAGRGHTGSGHSRSVRALDCQGAGGGNAQDRLGHESSGEGATVLGRPARLRRALSAPSDVMGFGTRRNPRFRRRRPLRIRALLPRPGRPSDRRRRSVSFGARRPHRRKPRSRAARPQSGFLRQ